MVNSTPLTQQWEETLLSTFLDMTRTTDGDFSVIDRLVQNSNDVTSFRLIFEHLCQHDQGKQAFENRPQLGDINLESLTQLPSNTFGYAYANHLQANGLKPLPAKPLGNDNQFLWFHITETHDIWHVVTGCDTSILGELQLEAFYVAQLQASRFWLALLTKNLLKVVLYDIERATAYMDAITAGWLMGKQAKLLFGIQWNLLWDTPLEDVRASLRILPLNN